MERVSGYDLWRADDVAVAARPVTWRGRLAKIAVAARPCRERSVLSPQLGQAPFERVPEAHQVVWAGIGTRAYAAMRRPALLLGNMPPDAPSARLRPGLRVRM